MGEYPFHQHHIQANVDKEQHTNLLEEAAMIFLAISEDPKDPDLLAEREQFLAKGEAHRQAYQKIENGWRVSGGRPRSRLPALVPFLLAMGAATYMAWEPARIYMLADFSTGAQAKQNALISGDLAYLDAGSAIADDTRSDPRIIELLRGSAYFDVEPDERPFVVNAGAAEITVVGTSFEASLIPDGVSISVAEGIVKVTVDKRVWQLTAGDQLFVSGDGAFEERSIETSEVATWRSGQLVVDNMTIRQVADILDRRIAGEVLVIGRTWAENRVSGTFDLDDPSTALKTLAIIGNARLIRGAPVASVLMPRQ